MDASPQMIAQAKSTHPNLEFFVADITTFTTDHRYDAIFSNATLHWVQRAHDAAHHISQALRQGGRFVAEFGGKGNVHRVSKAMTQALRAAGAPGMEELSPWYFPSVAEYAAVLERAGLETTFARLFDRPTEVEGGIREWVKMFGSTLIESVPPDRLNEFWTTLDQAGQSLEQDGKWYADYRRLRVVASKV
jgi:trans-aconitate methyltransferase